MPIASQSPHIFSPAQVNPDTIEASEIAADAVGASELADNSVASANVINDSIVNEDINSAAAIADSKLAQITTAGKVSGAALTALANIPAGAGVIPSANIPTPSASKLISKSESSVNDADNTNEQTAYSFTLNGGELSTGNILRVRVFITACTYHASSAPGKVYLKFGTTEMDNISIPSGASGAVGYVDLFVIGAGATNSQTSRAMGLISTTFSTAQSGTAAIDSASNVTVSICTKWAGSGWGQNITLGGYIAEILK